MGGPAGHTEPVIDDSMVPVAQQKWELDGEIWYRTVGLRWGGQETNPTMSLLIEGAAELEIPVHGMPSAHSDGFSLWWSDFWRPSKKGSFCLKPKFLDGSIQARRLSDGYYYRGVKISEV